MKDEKLLCYKTGLSRDFLERNPFQGGTSNVDYYPTTACLKCRIPLLIKVPRLYSSILKDKLRTITYFI